MRLLAVPLALLALMAFAPSATAHTDYYNFTLEMQATGIAEWPPYPQSQDDTWPWLRRCWDIQGVGRYLSVSDTRYISNVGEPQGDDSSASTNTGSRHYGIGIYFRDKAGVWHIHPFDRSVDTGYATRRFYDDGTGASIGTRRVEGPYGNGNPDGYTGLMSVKWIYDGYVSWNGAPTGVIIRANC